jgi:creatine kinase
MMENQDELCDTTHATYTCFENNTKMTLCLRPLQQVHVTNWSLDGIAGLPEGGQLDMAQLGLKDELSMRVRVGRNLTTFPLPGAMTKAQRIEFEQTMLKAFALLVQDPAYGGAIHSLTPHADWKEVTGAAENPNLMTPEKYDALVKAHVMFKVCI